MVVQPQLLISNFQQIQKLTMLLSIQNSKSYSSMMESLLISKQRKKFLEISNDLRKHRFEVGKMIKLIVVYFVISNIYEQEAHNKVKNEFRDLALKRKIK